MSRCIFPALILATLSAALTMAPADAQVPGGVSSGIEATATLKDAPPPPLSLKTLVPISFGTVSIPNKLRANAACSYELKGRANDASATSVEVSEFDGTTRVTGSGVSGCAVEGKPTVGQVALGCQTGLSVKYTVDYATAGIPGALFFAANLSSAGLIVKAVPYSESSNLARNSTYICAPAADGTATLLLFASLSLTNISTLPRGSKISVGTVTINVSY